MRMLIQHKIRSGFAVALVFVFLTGALRGFTILGDEVFFQFLKPRTVNVQAAICTTTAIAVIGGLLSLGLIGIAACREVTRLKKAEVQILELTASLQQRDAQIEAANQELVNFSYSVSHDLRAPLRHVHGYVEMLTKVTEGQLSDKALHYLKVINDSSMAMNQRIDDLLAYSRLNRVEMHESTVDLNQLVQQTLRSMEPVTKERKIHWKIAPLPFAAGDTTMIQQVLSNIIGNAVKFTRMRDPAEIEIGCAGEEHGRRIYFVRDNGAGFDMKYAGKLFGVFQRLHPAQEFEGAGIGLAIARRILARHGDRIWAEARPGEGATFFFTLKPAAAT